MGSSIFKSTFKTKLLNFLLAEQQRIIRENDECKWHRVQTLEFIMGRIADEDFSENTGN